MSEWLELELAEALKPVTAPPELWAGIRNAQRPRPARTRWATWPVAAILTLLVAAGTLWLVAKGAEPSSPHHQMAAGRLHEAPIHPAAVAKSAACLVCHTSI